MQSYFKQGHGKKIVNTYSLFGVIFGYFRVAFELRYFLEAKPIGLLIFIIFDQINPRVGSIWFAAHQFI